MNEKELKALQEQIEKKQAEQSAAIDALKTAHATEVAGLEKKLDKSEADIKTLSEQANAIQLELQQKAQRFNTVDSFADMKKSFTDKAKVEDMMKKGAPAMSFEIKAVIDEATYLSNSVLANAVIVPMREPGVGKAPDRIPTLLDIITRGNTGSSRISWVERSARTMNAGSVAAGTSLAQSDMTYIQKTAPVEEIGHYIKVDNSALEDWEYLLSEINTELFTGLEREIERQVYVGTGNTPEMQGITDTGIAAAYAVAALNGTVKSANQFDVLRVAYAQIAALNYRPNGIFINPIDAAAMDMPKNADGIYLLPPFIANDRTRVKGVPIYESTLVTAGSFLIGDFTKDSLFMRKGIELRIWEQNEDDVLKRRKTITAYCRAVNRIKTPDYNAFVFDTFAGAIALLGI